MTLTTIHSAKGLEWHTVFWCDLERRPGGGGGWGKDACLIGRDRLALKDPDAGKDDPQPPEWVALKALQDAESVAEQKRLWYVAATRAKQRLVLAGVCGATTGGAPLPRSCWVGLLCRRPRVPRSSIGGRATARSWRRCTSPVQGLPRRKSSCPIHGSPRCREVPGQFAPLPVPVGPARNSATSLMSHRAACAGTGSLRGRAQGAAGGARRDRATSAPSLAGRSCTTCWSSCSRSRAGRVARGGARGAVGRLAARRPDPGGDVREVLREEIRLVADQPEYRALSANPTGRREFGFLNVRTPMCTSRGSSTWRRARTPASCCST